MARALAATVAAALLLAAPAAADPASLYQGPGPRPGPDLLYAGPAAAPQLTNPAPWKPAPILVSGATSYRDGEFLYQDFLYDDHGANAGTPDPADPRRPRENPSGGDLFSQPDGTYTSPT